MANASGRAFGASIGLPHHWLTWVHLLLFETFLVCWGLASFLDPTSVTPYYCNLIFYPAFLVFAALFVGIIVGTFKAPTLQGRMVINVAYAADKFYFAVSIVIGLVGSLVVIFLFALTANFDADPTYLGHNISDVTNASDVRDYTLSSETDLFSIITAILQWTAFLAVLLVAGNPNVMGATSLMSPKQAYERRVANQAPLFQRMEEATKGVKGVVRQ